MKRDEKVSEIKRKKRKPFKAFSLDIKILNLDLKSSKEILDLKIGNLN